MLRSNHHCITLIIRNDELSVELSNRHSRVCEKFTEHFYISTTRIFLAVCQISHRVMKIFAKSTYILSRSKTKPRPADEDISRAASFRDIFQRYIRNRETDYASGLRWNRRHDFIEMSNLSNNAHPLRSFAHSNDDTHALSYKLRIIHCTYMQTSLFALSCEKFHA